MNYWLGRLGLLFWLATISVGLSVDNKLPYQNPQLPVEARLADLLPRMTLEEKVAQLNLWPNLAELLKHKPISWRQPLAPRIPSPRAE
jgi:hypothetical protein